MNEKESLEVRVNEILKQLEEHPDQAVEISKEEAEYMGAFEDDSMSMEDALASHGFESTQQDTPSNIKAFSGEKLELPIYYTKPKPRVVDAAETAARGEYLDIPAYVCRGIKDE